MKWRPLATVAITGVVFLGCDKIPFLGGRAAEEEATPDTTAQAPAPSEVPPAEQLAATPEPEPEPAPEPPPPAPVMRQISQMGEEPWFPTDTGTVRPGMTTDEVLAVWGAPVTERTLGDWTFIYYRNGCEQGCGTFDVVMLQGGQVVDAVVRGQGHTYAGLSSSPPDRMAEFTPPDTTADSVIVIG